MFLPPNYRPPLNPTVYGHSLPGQPEDLWEPLDVHLRRTAELAARFAAAFQSEQWGELAGLWHDLGKYLPAVQRRIHGEGERVEHAGLGAALAAGFGSAGYPLAFAIAGHHTGLANLGIQDKTAVLPLKERIARNAALLGGIRPALPPEIVGRALPERPSFLAGPVRKGPEAEAARRSLEMWTRFLFSALVDADFVATGEFYTPGLRDAVAEQDTIEMLRDRLDARLDVPREDTPVNRARARVLADCRTRAVDPPGFYSLTVPTGGGKTLSGMSFALRHAAAHGMERVIVVIPYTSIIEQSAAVYAGHLGARNVVEHHSAVDEEGRWEEDSALEARRRLAAENWDARVVVTTSVQFFESLFAARPSRCRKLHNVARSVIVLDEVQSLSTDFLACILDALRELVRAYGCTVVLSTATQPALRRRDTFPIGLDPVTEIIHLPGELAATLERVRVEWPAPDGPPTLYAELAEEIDGHDQVLAVVHRRRDARTLAQAVAGGDMLHLSALMCAAHRTDVLADVKRRLDAGRRCRLVSTQLVEAGVDIDFPVVYRALAGLDSVAQAAGRCNRNGKHEQGRVVVFRAETEPPAGILRMGMEATRGMLRRHGDRLNFVDATYLDEYFRGLYARCELDPNRVQAERAALNFATVADKVKLIADESTHSLVVPYGDSARRLDAFRANPGLATQRALQPFIVQVRKHELDALQKLGALEMVQESVYALLPQARDRYDVRYGLSLDPSIDPEP
ncbi:MAG: CRISPR-associated protein Cas3 [Gemmatimonadetes bacterium]|nr:CRISPR-associated protein Cas3 [Gemmatimonadota bacterium]